MPSTISQNPRAVAVYCASSLGVKKAYQHAAESVGYALAEDNRPLVYGGGIKGLMGIVSAAALERGGKVIGVRPWAIHIAGGEGEKANGIAHLVKNVTRNNEAEVILVDSMSERKKEMAQRSGTFLALAGGYGTYEEVLEVTTWTQIGIHNKQVIVLNVLGFYEPLKALIKNGVDEGFIQPPKASLISFVDGPLDHAEHDTFDWGKAALNAMEAWVPSGGHLFDWSKKMNGQENEDLLAST